MGFDTGALQRGLAGRRMGWPLHLLEEVDSTNRLALVLARQGAPEGTAVLADRQTAGRGRLRRPWQSPPGCNLYTSLLLRPAIRPAEAAGITLLAGVAVAEALQSYCPRGVGLKWPNDVRIGGRKVCGILAETLLRRGALQAVVVGIGVNVNMAREAFAAEFRAAATSLAEEAGTALVREEVALGLYASLERWYGRFLDEGFAPVRERWLGLSEMEGQWVRVLFRDELVTGQVAGIDRDGALLLADGQGRQRRITAGDATLLKEGTDREGRDAAGH